VGQKVPEAMAMFAEYRKRRERLPNTLVTGPHFFDTTSGNSIQNIQNIGRELIESGLAQKGDHLNVNLASTDYHVERIIKIQQQMNEQGLLRVLEKTGQRLGIKIEIQRNMDAHVAAPFPYRTDLGRIYVEVDRLTIYRVYLEGVVKSAFKRELSRVRSQPRKEAVQAIDSIRSTVARKKAFGKRRSQFILSSVSVIESIIDKTSATAEKSDVASLLVLYDRTLTMLNRYVDPEGSIEGQWWA